MSYRFQFYPTLLNEYHRYVLSPTQERFDALIRRINRVPETDPEVLKRFKRGISFEDALLKNTPSQFSKEVLEKARSYLPQNYHIQQKVAFVKDNIRFYGYTDVVGERRVIDIKSTAKHRPGRHDFNFQNLYLYALKDLGFTKMEYLITDGTEVFIEQYELSNYNFSPLLDEMQGFRDFLVKHKALINDRKVMQEVANDLFG